VNNNERIRVIDELPKLTDYVQETLHHSAERRRFVTDSSRDFSENAK